MATKFTPLHDRILIRRVEEAETTRGGLIIPDSAKDKPQEGEVLSVGRGKSNDEGKVFPLAVKEGDRVLFGKYAGTEIKLDGEDFIIMREEEVLGILVGAAPKKEKELAGSRRYSLNAIDIPQASSLPQKNSKIQEKKQWQSRLFTARSRGKRLCAALTFWPTLSR